MTLKHPAWLAVGGLLAMAAGMGIGRFVYTPILPAMISGLEWSKLDAGLVASANFLGYMIGAFVVGRPTFAVSPRSWLVAALVASTASTAGMALSGNIALLLVLRFIGGVASAFVIICSSTLVLERLAAVGRGELASIHFAGVGVGIVASAIAVSTLGEAGVGWQGLWLASGLVSAGATVIAIALIPPSRGAQGTTNSIAPQAVDPALTKLAVAHGLFGFGYVITATFLLTIVRETAAIRPLEPWVWVIVGIATIPSVPLWQWLGWRVGLLRAYAVACLVEAIGVAFSVEWSSIAGVALSAALLGGTFMGLTALGLMAARELSGSRPQWAIGITTASFALGQMIGPTIAGVLAEISGSLRAATLLAAAALIVAAILTCTTAIADAHGPDARRERA
ncbi:MAG: YbfB/YjiJ family MFS transporter [Hyphomicrobiaceae bacterium]